MDDIGVEKAAAEIATAIYESFQDEDGGGNVTDAIEDLARQMKEGNERVVGAVSEHGEATERGLGDSSAGMTIIAVSLDNLVQVNAKAGSDIAQAIHHLAEVLNKGRE